jgi:uncharacterized protein
MKSGWWLALGFTLVAGNVSAASFDCSKAVSFAEREICKDGYLSRTDEMLAVAYANALKYAGDPDSLRQSQRQWLAVRNECTTQKCLDQTIGARIQALEALAQTERTQAYDAKIKLENERRQAERDKQDRLASEASAVSEEQERQRKAAVSERNAKIDQALRQGTYNSSKIAPAAPAAPAQIPPSTSRSAAAVPAAQVSRSNPAVKWFINGPGWKYLLLLGAILSAWGVFRHHRGAATIYSDYTDALITNSLPAVGVLVGAICRWLEMPWAVTVVSAVIGFVLSIAYAVYATVKSNRGGLSIFLSIVAKLTLISVFFAVIGMLIASLFVSTRYKGESRARAAARNRREAKKTMAAIAAISAVYTAFTVWLCRSPRFSTLGECFEFNRPPRLP